MPDVSSAPTGVVFDVDGFAWNLRAPLLRAVPLSVAGLAGTGALAVALGPWALLGGAAATLLLTAAVHRSNGQAWRTVTVRRDRVWLERRNGAREELLFRDLESARVVGQPGDGALSFKTREGVTQVRAADEEVAWVCDALQRAMAHHDESQRQSGREVFTDRQRPDALAQLLER